MKKLFSISASLCSAALLSLAMVSCSEDIMDDINKDNNHTTDVPGKYIMADVITSTAFNNTGGDLNTYASIYIEHEAGVDNQTLRAETREGEPSASSTVNNTWGSLYGTLNDVKIALNKGVSEESDKLLEGTAEVMLAYNLAILTDMFGDTPWTEACDYVNFMNPKIDTQETIYADIMLHLDNAIAALDGAPNTLSDYDFLYKGNSAKWLKFAYGLKARYTMRLMARSTDVAGDMNKVIEYIDKSFASVDEEAAFNIYDATNLNPSFDFQWSRDGLSSSQSMFDKLAERNDPRKDRVYYDPSAWSHVAADDVILAENGVADGGKYYYSYGAYSFAQTASTLLLSYHELLFLKAEALCRLGRSADAETVLKEAVEVAIQNTEKSITAAVTAPTVVGYGGLEDITADALTDADADAYFDAEVKPLFDANPLKEVMNQKYIAFWGASGESLEAYNDVRRMKALGEDFITLNHPRADKFPFRFPYGGDDTTANPNVKEAYGDGEYVYTEPVWWANGTR